MSLPCDQALGHTLWGRQKVPQFQQQRIHSSTFSKNHRIIKLETTLRISCLSGSQPEPHIKNYPGAFINYHACDSPLTNQIRIIFLRKGCWCILLCILELPHVNQGGEPPTHPTTLFYRRENWDPPGHMPVTNLHLASSLWTPSECSFLTRVMLLPVKETKT